MNHIKTKSTSQFSESENPIPPAIIMTMHFQTRKCDAKVKCKVYLNIKYQISIKQNSCTPHASPPHEYLSIFAHWPAPIQIKEIRKMKKSNLDWPSANLAMSCRRPVAPRSIPARSISSVSRAEDAPPSVPVRSVTLPTFIGRPANSKPFSCSRAFFASSGLRNWKKKKRKKENNYTIGASSESQNWTKFGGTCRKSRVAAGTQFCPFPPTKIIFWLASSSHIFATWGAMENDLLQHLLFLHSLSVWTHTR